MSEIHEKQRSMRPSLFVNFTESYSTCDPVRSPKSPLDFKASKSPRNFEEQVVGLGIVAAMNEASDTHEAFSNRAAKIALSPRSDPIPISSARNSGKFLQEEVKEVDDIELSESYTCVISHVGNEKIRKHEYFDRPTDGGEGCFWEDTGVFFASPPAYTGGGGGEMFTEAEFLNSCYLCRKKLHGLDIFMYRGEKAFCSVECRCQQILNDEYKEKCGSEALKSYDCSVSPCSAPRLFSAGVAAA